MSKRGNGEGSIYKYGKKWRVSISVPGPNGTRSRRTKTCDSRADAVAALQVLRAMGAKPHEVPLTVGQLVSLWVENGKLTWAENTLSQVEWITNDWVPKMELCHFPAVDLSSQQVRSALTKLKDEHNASGRILQLARGALLAAYNQANKDKSIAVNPVVGVKRPTDEPEQIFPFTEEEVRAILTETRGSRYHALFALAVTAGPRIGELCGLRPKHVDMDSGTVRIEEQLIESKGRLIRKRPKTKSSRRTVDLTETAKEALTDHFAMLLREGRAGGEHLFPSDDGGPTWRSNFDRSHWGPLLERLGLEHRGFHHCRHTYATLALRRGVPVAVVSAVLGHARPDVTYRIYAHYIRGDQRMSTAAMDSIFSGGAPVAIEQSRKSS